MKQMVTALTVFILAIFSVLPVYAVGGKVTYAGHAQEFIFAPGSEQSLTDLFPQFKGVMPGDTLTQTITVQNDASREVKADIYLRSLGAHADSAAFLSQLRLRVQTAPDNAMAYMFDAAADETAQLTDWVCLGTLYSGGEVTLEVTLEVPAELDNAFQNQVGYLDWEFKVEEFPVEESDPDAPQTGDTSAVGSYMAWMAGALLVLFLLHRRKKDGIRKSSAPTV